MGPKKKGNRRQDDDWEAELGEDISGGANGQPAAAPPAENNAAPEDEMGGGLLATLRKSKAKKAKKGKALDNDWVEGEDPTQGTPDGPDRKSVV